MSSQNPFQNSDDYKRYKLIKELKEKASDYINDLTDSPELENAYCDTCDRKLVEWEIDRLICPACHIITDPQFTIAKHKPAREGPVDEITNVDDYSGLSEHYSFKTREEEKDDFIASLQAKGYTIVSSSKK